MPYKEYEGTIKAGQTKTLPKTLIDKQSWDEELKAASAKYPTSPIKSKSPKKSQAKTDLNKSTT